MRKFLVGLAALTAVTTGLVFAADVGPKADVAAVRAAVRQLSPKYTISGVHVVGDYAVLHWYTEHAAGPAVFKRISGERWKKIMGGGGAITVSAIVHLGVPASAARQLCSGWGGPKNSPFC
jgi:hypothetical protein